MVRSDPMSQADLHIYEKHGTSSKLLKKNGTRKEGNRRLGSFHPVNMEQQSGRLPLL